MLVISGREQALINLGGDKVSPERVEAALMAYGRVRDAAAFAVMTPLGLPVLCCGVVWREQPDMTGLQEHLRKMLPPYLTPKFFIPFEFIPRNQAGKIDRARVKETAAKRRPEVESKVGKRVTPIALGAARRPKSIVGRRFINA